MKKEENGERFSNSTLSDHLLCLAALFEEDFSIDWLVSLTKQRPSQVLSGLEESVKSGCLTNKKPGVYTFADAQSRKKWREHLSIEKRQVLHKEIVNIIMREVPDSKNKLDLLACHLMQVSNDVEGCHWLIKAAENYMEAYETEKAVQCYEKVLADLANLQGEIADSLFSKVTIAYSKFAMARHDTQDVLAVIREGLARAKESKMKEYEALLEMQLARIEWFRSEFAAALSHFEAGWSIAKRSKNPNLLRSVTNFSSFFLYWKGRFREAIKSYEGTVPDVQDLPAKGLLHMSAFTMGVCYANCGQITQGLGMLDTLQSIFADRNDHYWMAFSLSAIGHVMLEIRRLEDAIDHLEWAIELAYRGNNQWVKMLASLMLALAYLLKGEDGKGLSTLRKYIQNSNNVNLTFQTFPYLIEILWHMQEAEMTPIPNHSITSELNRMLTSENIYIKGIAYRYRSLLLRREGKPHEKVVQNLNVSINLLKEAGTVIELVKSEFDLAREYLFRGDETTANEIMAKVSKTLSSLGAFGDALLPNDLKAFIGGPRQEKEFLKEILKLGQEIVNVKDDKKLVNYIISTVNRITGAERGAIFLVDDHTNPKDIRLRGAKNLSYEQIESTDFQYSKHIMDQVLLTGKSCLAGPNPSNGLASDRRRSIRSRMCVPMVLKERVVGLLYHDNRLLQNVFKESDLELIGYFAALVAITLDNAASREEIKQLNQKLKEEKSYYEEQHLHPIQSDEIVGESDAIKRVMSQVAQVAPTDSAVLILGESGVGKELVAQAIHRQSVRYDKPFIRVNCSVLSDTLIQSELFGHEKGAFTGATQRRIGRFELADGGTVFLDEIGELPLEMQVRLLHVLQTKEFERLGGSQRILSDFRLIAATNRDLEREVEKGRFRLDLYYRLNVFPIHVPSLRERKCDIPLLSQFFLRKVGTRMNKRFLRIREQEIERLIRYDWPGNVRELENIIERGAILSSGRHFSVPELVSNATPERKNHHANMTLKEIERREILSVLEKTEWKVRGPGGAAELLDIHPSTLNARMKKLGIRRPSGIPKKRGNRSPSVLSTGFDKFSV